jgi:hypothetical protein
MDLTCTDYSPSCSPMQIFTQINLVRKIPLHTRTKRIHCMDYSMAMLKKRCPFSRGTYPPQ